MPFRFLRHRHPTADQSPAMLRSFRAGALAIAAGLVLATTSHAQYHGRYPSVIEGQNVSRGPHSGFGTIERVGRWLGAGWGDGYHSSEPSGARPLANLPPKYRWQNSPAAAGHPSPSYYDRFDAVIAAHEHHGFLTPVNTTDNQDVHQSCQHCQRPMPHASPANQPQPRPAKPESRREPTPAEPTPAEEQPLSPSDLDVYFRVPAEHQQRRLPVSVTVQPAARINRLPDPVMTVESNLGRPAVNRPSPTSTGSFARGNHTSSVGLGHPNLIPGPGYGFESSVYPAGQRSAAAAVLAGRIRQPATNRATPVRSGDHRPTSRSVPRVAIAPANGEATR